MSLHNRLEFGAGRGMRRVFFPPGSLAGVDTILPVSGCVLWAYGTEVWGLLNPPPRDEGASQSEKQAGSVDTS